MTTASLGRSPTPLLRCVDSSMKTGQTSSTSWRQPSSPKLLCQFHVVTIAFLSLSFLQSSVLCGAGLFVVILVSQTWATWCTCNHFIYSLIFHRAKTGKSRLKLVRTSIASTRTLRRNVRIWTIKLLKNHSAQESAPYVNSVAIECDVRSIFVYSKLRVLWFQNQKAYLSSFTLLWRFLFVSHLFPTFFGDQTFSEEVNVVIMFSALSLLYLLAKIHMIWRGLHFTLRVSL